MNRSKKDAPDIVMECIRGKEYKRKVYVGIEHFRVDQVSRQKGKKRTSLAAEHKSHVFNTYEKGHQVLLMTDSVSSEVQDLLMLQVANWMQDNASTDIESLLDDLEYNVGRHLEKVDSYWNNLEDFAKNDDVEIAFLIELHAKFPYVLLSKREKTWASEVDRILVIEELVDILARIDKKKVDYVVLVYYPDDLKPPTDVLVLRTGNVGSHLMNQKIDIYANAFMRSKPIIISIKAERNNNDFKLQESSTVDRYADLMQLLHNVRIAYECKQRGVPYAASIEAKAFMEAAYENILGFQKETNDIIFKPDTDFVKMQRTFLDNLDKYKGIVAR